MLNISILMKLIFGIGNFPFKIWVVNITNNKNYTLLQNWTFMYIFTSIAARKKEKKMKNSVICCF